MSLWATAADAFYFKPKTREKVPFSSFLTTSKKYDKILESILFLLLVKIVKFCTLNAPVHDNVKVLSRDLNSLVGKN